MPQPQEEITIEITPSLKQNLAWISLFDHQTKNIVFGGGGGGGKSWMGCEWLLVQCLRFPDFKGFIAREKLKTLKQSTLLTFFKVAKAHGLKRDVNFFYKQQESYIEFPNGSRIDLLELKYNPSDPLFEDLGSLEFTAGWIEEAGEIDTRAYDTIKTRIGRHMNDKYNLYPKLLITCNPKKNWLYTEFYKPWKEKRLPNDCVFIQALVDDNPFNESEYKTMLMAIKDPVKRQRLLDGNWEYDSDAGTLMDYDAINDLWSNTVDESKEKYLTVDVARFGKDNTVMMFWQGFKLYRVEVLHGLDTSRVAEKIREFAKEEKIPYSHIAVDEDGVGGGVVDQCRGVRGFVNNSSPLPNIEARPIGGTKEDKKKAIKMNFANLKAQCSYLMSEKVNNHEVEIAIDDMEFQEALSQELEIIKQKDPFNDEAPLALVPKEELKGIIGRSPDNSDAFIMRMFFGLKREYRNSGDFDQRQKEQMRALAQPIQPQGPIDKWKIG